MLLSHEIPEKELKWFRDKGILVKKCLPILKKNFKDYPAIVLDKFYLFTPYFKHWKSIIFLDADIIVRAPLDKLTKVKGFAAVKDIHNLPISFNFDIQENKKFSNLKKTYNLHKVGFNSGVIAFNTKIINSELKNNIIFTIKEYFDVANGDQPILNIIFNKIDFLPSIYNVYIPNYAQVYQNIGNRKEATILHFCGRDKPWQNKNNPFYKEWKSNLDKANLIMDNCITRSSSRCSSPDRKLRTKCATSYAVFCNINKPQKQKMIISNREIKNFDFYLNSLQNQLNRNHLLAELYRKEDYKNYRKQLLKGLKEDPSLLQKSEIIYYFSSFFPKKIKNKLKKILNK
jgi:lipopolysaccharide biosynthesis glycosyltransferase